MRNKINSLLVDQIELFDLLQKSFEKQKVCVKNNKLFELDSIAIDMNNICKKIADVEIKIRELLQKTTIRDFVMENKEDEELYGSYIFLVSQVEKLNLIKSDNEFLIKKSLGFINKLLHAINKDNKSNVYTRKLTY